MIRPLIKIASIAAAISASTLVLGATAAHAQPADGAYYAATPVTQPSTKSFITRDTLWKWRDGAFVANKGVENALVVCSLAAQRAGKLSTFTVAGTALDATALDKCNARAR